MATLLVSGNRRDLKKCFEKMFYHISTNDLGELDICVSSFEVYCLKYCIARGQDFKVFQKAVRGIHHSVTHFNNPRIRTRRLYEQMVEIHNLFTESEEKMSLKNKLKMISEDLAYDISLLFEVEGDFDPSAIFDGFDSLIELGDDVRKEGYEVYQIFRQLIRNVGVVKPYVPTNVSKANQPRPADVKILKQFMAPVFSVLDDLITTFSEPPAPAKKSADGKKKNEQYGVLDIDELKKDAKVSQALDLIFKQNWLPQNVARHLNMTIEELLDILGVELDGEDEKEEDHKTADNEKDKNIENDGK